jgi:hypothetical protein
VVYVRRVSSRNREYNQLVRSYRENGKVKQEVIAHLGELSSADEALEYWPQEIELLRRTGQQVKADKLVEKLTRVRELTEGRDIRRVDSN